MAMTLNEIRESGLLELYVLGELNQHLKSEVEAAITVYPELKRDIADIERVLFAYAKAHAVNPPASVLEQLMEQTRDTSSAKGKETKVKRLNTFSAMMAAASIALLLFSVYLFNANQNQQNRYTALLDDCDKNKHGLEVLLAEYEALNSGDNNTVVVAATEKYPETKIVLHTNDAAKLNYLQLQNLPEIAVNQSFQLWSLKEDSDPIPLDVFEKDGSNLLAVKYVDATNAYAITIEPKGGSKSPTLENLIGVFSLKS